MTLPVLVTPEYTAVVPSTQETLRYRPFLVKEEKILYFAMESGEQKDMINAIKQIFKACFLDDINLDKLTYFDFEYLFLQLRTKSVSEVSEFTLTHQKCETTTDVKLPLDKVNVKFIEDASTIIDITDDLGIQMRYPSIDDVQKVENADIDSIIDLFCDCVVNVFEKKTDKVYDGFEKKELKIWIENLTQTQFKNITNFFETMPKLSHELKYQCKVCDEEVSITLEGLQSFF
jgi:hypothetical protein